MVQLPLGWTHSAYDVPVSSGLASRRAGTNKASRSAVRVRRHAVKARNEHRDIAVPMGWAGSAYAGHSGRARG